MWNRTVKIAVLVLVIHVVFIDAKPVKEDEKNGLQDVKTTEQPETSTFLMEVMEKLKQPREKGDRRKKWKAKARKAAKKLRDRAIAKAKVFSKKGLEMTTSLFGKVDAWLNSLDAPKMQAVAKVEATPNKPKRWYRRALSKIANKMRPKDREKLIKGKKWLKTRAEKAKAAAKTLKGHSLLLYKEILKIDANDKISFETERKRIVAAIKKHGVNAWKDIRKKNALPPTVPVAEVAKAVDPVPDPPKPTDTPPAAPAPPVAPPADPAAPVVPPAAP